ncbi:MAG TPA: tRNA (guanosine(46)-N7)-methyltransferase TrmB [Spirochaetota bacterium]|nr:tRNA (guanosine(46)-N7)-methyltransferase TrmB [Spirochaetota bacterium]HOL56703.1 tRNA (guanosine(46)-N7)-methyltransferase TrmB [Spirochaetota bacterium]HPP04110.1 tRNA (guanosine(46)-N7)-methyltransferase TrmB [Spirochaetota bacterium]
MVILREWDITNPEKFKKNDYKKRAIDIGCGNGLFLASIAKNNPDITFFGLEIKAKYINKTKKKIERENLSNIILINGDLFTALDKFFEKDFFDYIYINFPDPWPKKKHIKKRAISETMVKKYYEIMTKESILYFVTDNIEYRDYAIDIFLKSDLFISFLSSPYFVEELEGYPVSLYEKKWREEGKKIYYILLKKI